jgi:hypothetical protein
MTNKGANNGNGKSKDNSKSKDNGKAKAGGLSVFIPTHRDKTAMNGAPVLCGWLERTIATAKQIPAG